MEVCKKMRKLASSSSGTQAASGNARGMFFSVTGSEYKCNLSNRWARRHGRVT